MKNTLFYSEVLRIKFKKCYYKYIEKNKVKFKKGVFNIMSNQVKINYYQQCEECQKKFKISQGIPESYCPYCGADFFSQYQDINGNLHQPAKYKIITSKSF